MERLMSQSHDLTSFPHTYAETYGNCLPLNQEKMRKKRDFQKLIILVNKWIEANIATNHRRTPMVAPKLSVWIYTVIWDLKVYIEENTAAGPSLLKLQRTECVWETEHVCKYIYLSIYLCASVKACRDSHVVLFIFILGRSGLLSGTGWSRR